MTCGPFFTVTPLSSEPCPNVWIPYHFISLVQWKFDKESSVQNIHLTKVNFLITNVMNNSKLSWKEKMKKRKVTTHLKFCWDQTSVSQRSDHHPDEALQSDSFRSVHYHSPSLRNYRNQPLWNTSSKHFSVWEPMLSGSPQPKWWNMNLSAPEANDSM